MGDVRFESYAQNVENYIYIDVLSDKMEVGARRGLIEASQNIVNETKKNILNGPHTGIKYKRLRVRSSRAGEYPANQTGKLRRGIGFEMLGTKRVFIGSTAHYSQYLAFGTRKMGARAFIGNVIKDNMIKTYDTIARSINREINL